MSLPASRFDPDQMFAEVRSLVATVRQPQLRELLLGLLDDPEIGPAFRSAPAAKGVHHPFTGGLCEHTLSVLQLGWRICDHYPQLDRDLVTAGCLLHDLGKTRELAPAGSGFDYTEEGRLVGHLVIATQWIHERAARIAGFPRELTWHLVHLVAAHHGKLEYGSPKEPATLEALVVHAVDELDSRVSSFGLLFEQAEGGWTDRRNLYGTRLFAGPSWNGAPLPPDERRFEGPGIYRSLRSLEGLRSPEPAHGPR
jgi:3'-5' exoribonuclease